MSLAQQNFDRARVSARDTLRSLAGPEALDFHLLSTRELQTLAWDLEAIEAALRMELNTRLAGPDSMVDLG